MTDCKLYDRHVRRLCPNVLEGEGEGMQAIASSCERTICRYVPYRLRVRDWKLWGRHLRRLYWKVP